MASRSWEVASEVREIEEGCRTTLEAALAASRALDAHLAGMATVDAPGRPSAMSVTPEWRRAYRRLSEARAAAFVAFDDCIARIEDTTA